MVYILYFFICKILNKPFKIGKNYGEHNQGREG